MKARVVLCLCVVLSFFLTGCGEPQNAKDVFDKYNASDKPPCHLEGSINNDLTIIEVEDKETHLATGHETITGDNSKNIFCGQTVEYDGKEQNKIEVYYDAESGTSYAKPEGEKNYWYNNRRTFTPELLVFDFSDKEMENMEFDQNDKEYIIKIDLSKSEYHGLDKLRYFYYGDALVKESELKSGTLTLKFNKKNFSLDQYIVKNATVEGESLNGIYGSWGTRIKAECEYNITIDFSKHGKVKEPVIPQEIKNKAKSVEAEEAKDN